MISIIAVHVNNCIILAHKKLLEPMKATLLAKFKMKDLSKAQSILRMELLHNHKAKQLYMQQKGRINKILNCFSMTDSKDLSTPMNIGLSLPKLLTMPAEDQHLPYRSAISKLSYLTQTGQPNILYTVHYLSHFSNGYSQTHWQAVKHVLCYLQGTCTLTICYNHQHYDAQDWSSLLPHITVNANFGPSNQDNCKSLSTVKVLMCRGVVAWSVKMQLCIALSTTEAELYAISTSMCQALYMWKLFPPLSLPVNLPVHIYNDNQLAITIIHSKGGNFHGTKKHYNIHVKHAHDSLSDGQITLSYCPTKQLLANILMKTLGQVHFNELVSLNSGN